MKIRESEKQHRGEICLAVESGLDIAYLARGKDARDRAADVFSQLRVWDTKENNGVLIYLLLADRRIEILADRGIVNAAGANIWQSVCDEMKTLLRAGRYEEALSTGIDRVTKILADYFPHLPGDTNELPDRPTVL